MCTDSYGKGNESWLRAVGDGVGYSTVKNQVHLPIISKLAVSQGQAGPRPSAVFMFSLSCSSKALHLG